MADDKDDKDVGMQQATEGSTRAVGASQGARRATGEAPAARLTGPLGPGQRWSLARKREVVIRILRGESLDALSRELGIEMYRLEQWRDRAMSGMEGALRERNGDPREAELDGAYQRIGELTMEVELLRVKVDRKFPFSRKRSKR